MESILKLNLILFFPPDAAGLFCEDKYTNTSNGQRFTWGISHITQSKSKPWAYMILSMRLKSKN